HGALGRVEAGRSRWRGARLGEDHTGRAGQDAAERGRSKPGVGALGVTHASSPRATSCRLLVLVHQEPVEPYDAAPETCETYTPILGGCCRRRQDAHTT